MHKFLRLLLSLAFIALAAGVPVGALADIKITITDGTSTVSPTNPKPGFNLSMPSPAGQTTTMHLLICSSRPCIVYFPSGLTSPQTGDIFMFRDACGPNPLPTCPTAPFNPTSQVARVVKTDSPSTDKIELKGLQVTALPGVIDKKVTVIFETESGDLATVPSGSYPWVAALVGTFTKKPPHTVGGNGGLTAACPNPDLGLTDPQLLNPCSRLWLGINGVTVNDIGPMAIGTVSIPCKNGRINPCARVGGGYYSTGTFNTYESASITFSTSTNPVHKAMLYEMIYKDKDQTHAVANSGIVAMSRLTEEEFGVEGVFYSLANELGGNFWVAFTAGNELYRAAPRIEEAQKISDLEVPIAFELEQGNWLPVSKGVTLTSIVTDEALTITERARNNRSYASFIAQPMKLQWKNVNLLRLVYQVSVDDSDSGDPRLGKLTFSDCVNASFRLRVALTSVDGGDAGNLVINLGSAQQFTSGCATAAATLSGSNLVQNKDPRGDPSFLLEKFARPCCMTVKDSQAQAAYGNLVVRSVSVVVDQGWSNKPVANYKVNLLEAMVNGIKATPSLRVAGNYKPLSDLPDDGRSMVITKLNGSQIAPIVIGNEAIQNDGSRLHTRVPVELLSPDPGSRYRVDLCLFGGRCVPNQGFFTLW